MDVEDLVRRAAEAAKHVPEHLQEAAFNRVFDALLAGEKVPPQTKGDAPASRRGEKTKTRAPQREDRADNLNKLDRTAHAEIAHKNTALENALRLLRAVKDDLGIDGLSATEISEMLISTFRCRVSRRQVARVLNEAGQYVNRQKEGRSVIFRIMAAGEDYLDKLSAEQKEYNSDSASPKVESSAGQEKTKKKPKKRTRSATRRVGPAAAMSTILDEDYFSSPRTIRDMIEKLKHDRGRTFKANELSPVLVRWLRAGKLERKKNADGQYEYTAP